MSDLKNSTGERKGKVVYNIGIVKGIFGADMKIELLNDGPVTIVLDSKELF